LLAAAFFALSARAANAQETEPPQATPAALDNYESRLTTDMMFAGKLADAMLESGLYGKYIPVSHGDDRATLRTKLILWIRSHPREAAKLHIYSTEPAGGAEKAYNMKKMRFWLSKHLVDLADKLRRDARNPGFSDEQLALAPRQLFDGKQASNDTSAPVLPRAAVRTGRDSASQPAPLSWKLDIKNLDSEERRDSAWLSAMRADLRRDRAAEAARLSGTSGGARRLLEDKAALEKALSAVIEGATVEHSVNARFGQRAALLAAAGAKLSDFDIYLSRFLGRNRLQPQEAAALTALRAQLRSALAKAYCAGRLDGIEKTRSAIAAAASARFGWTAEEAAAYAAAGGKIAALSADTEAQYRRIAVSDYPAAQMDEVYARLDAITRSDDKWRALAHIYSAAPELLHARAQLWDSCVLHRILSRIFSGLRPNSGYALASRGADVYGHMADRVTLALLHGDYDWAVYVLENAAGTSDPHSGLSAVTEQYHLCLATLNSARLRSDMLQSALITAPFYSAVAPAARAAMKKFRAPPRGSAGNSAATAART